MQQPAPAVLGREAPTTCQPSDQAPSPSRLHGQPLTGAHLKQLLQQEAAQLLRDELEAQAQHRDTLEALLAGGQQGSEQLDVSATQQQADGWDPDPGVLLQHDELAAAPPESRRLPGQQHGPAPGEEGAWQEFHQLPPLGEEQETTHQRVAALVARLRHICTQPGEYALPPDWGESDWEGWLAELSALLPDPDAFQAHSLRQHYPAWAALLGDRERRPSRDVLRTLRKGIAFRWRHPRSEEQQKHPRWRQNLQRIERAIAQVHGAHRVPSFLDAPEPQPIHLPNHRSISSTPEHATFTSEQIGKLEGSGAAKTWPFKRPPKVVLPLGVAANAAGKLRLVLDGGYVNLWAGKHPHSSPVLPVTPGHIKPGMHGNLH
jgi:hypothetical protein